MDSNEKRQENDFGIVPRRWGILPTLDMYVLREFMIKFSILLLVFIILFILSDVFNDLGDFLDAGAPFSSILTYLVLRLPYNIRFVLPIATLLGCMWTMAMFGKNLEVTAMRSCGVSLFRCGLSIFAVGLIVTMINIFFNESFVPETSSRAEELKERATGKKEEIKSFNYRNPERTRSWFFNSLVQGNEQNQISLKHFRPDGSVAEDWHIEKASFHPKTGWTFYKVKKTAYSPDGLMPKQTVEEDVVNVPVKEITETPDDIFNSTKDEENLPTWVIWNIVSKNPNIPDNVKAKYMTVFYYRIAFPWACFLAVFLGIPLATKNERSGSLLAIVVAVLVIVAYIAMAELFQMLGKNGAIPPVIAGLAPTIAFIVYGYCKVFYDKN